MSLKLSARSRYKNLNLISLWVFLCFFIPGRILRILSKHYFFKKQSKFHSILFCFFQKFKRKRKSLKSSCKGTIRCNRTKVWRCFGTVLGKCPLRFFFCCCCCLFFVFRWGSLRGVCSLFGAQSQNGRVSDCRGPHRLLPDISVPSLVGDTERNL